MNANQPDDLIIVRDRRRKRYYVADNLIIDHYLPVIGDKGLTLYSLLCRLASDKLEMARPGYVLLCEHTGWSRSTVWAYRRLLEITGLVEVVSGGGRRTNIYYLLDVQPLTAQAVQRLTERIESEFKNGFQRQILDRLSCWKPLQARFQDRPTKPVAVAGQSDFWFHGETTPFHGETGSRDDETTPFHGETGSTRSSQESQDKNQEQEATATTGPAPVAYVSRDVADALEFLGILASQHEKIAAGWLAERGEALTVADITAWREYVRETNSTRYDKRQHLRPGFIVDNLRRGNLAPGARKRKGGESMFCDSCGCHPCICDDTPIFVYVN